MAIDITIHQFSDPIQIVSEYPDNSLSVTIACGGTEIIFYFEDGIEQWYGFRRIFPKAPGYSMFAPGNQHIYDHAEADAFAAAYLAARLPAISAEVVDPERDEALTDASDIADELSDADERNDGRDEEL